MSKKDNSKFKIYPLKIEEPKRKIKINEDFPMSVPGISLVCAPVRTGKTCLVSNILIREEMLNVFDEVYVYSPVVFNCKSSKWIREHFNCNAEYTDASLQAILDKQNEYVKNNNIEKRPSICIFFDDCVNMFKNNSLAVKISSMYRHFGIDQIIFSIQKYKGIPPTIRANISTLILLAPNNNTKQLEQINDELDCFGGYDNFIRLFNEATKNQERYNFLLAQIDYSPPKIWSNFEKVIQS